MRMNKYNSMTVNIYEEISNEDEQKDYCDPSTILKRVFRRNIASLMYKESLIRSSLLHDFISSKNLNTDGFL